MKVRILTETQQRGTFATMLLLYKKLLEIGIDAKIYTTFNSEYNVLPYPNKSRIFGYEKMVNNEKYAEKIFGIIYESKDTIIHIANAMYGILPIAEKNNAKTIINIQYWWPTCYFNSMENPYCDCKSFTKIAQCIYNKRDNYFNKLLSPIEAIYAINKLNKIKEYVSKASIILAVSNIVRDILISRGFPEDKIRVINVNAITLPIDYVEYHPSNNFTFGYLSYPDEGKGIFQLLKAFSIALKYNRNMKLKILGGLEEPRVIEMVKSLRIEDRVVVTRRFPYSEYVSKIRDMLLDVDVVVVPTLVPDTWARVVTESMLAGRPVIVTKGNGGLVEQVTDGIDGFHVNVYDLNDFALSLYNISQLPRSKIEEMGKIARENIMKKYDNKKIIEQIISLYHKLLEI
ncbi:glycosyl transferase group 1 [Sulfolobus islandicus Y.N.15.51]|uniref:Glycosyl transferase group 1 n=1 Tax=Saccharolobus islandicus (strain Y.N.15.51 / Yellowstone \|nr:glycosyltransferase family 4 protein [Sulfolobus islandicus]ACP49302.1 glycosyl transferase group 1 [Sulfolobus islandicus Y.N.15.51]